MRVAVGLIRIAVAVAIGAAIVASFVDAALRGPVNPANFFGYFTVQSNTLIGLALAMAGVNLLAKRPSSPLLDYFRAAAVTYITFGGLVYALLLAPLGAEGGIPVPWANVVLHIVTPLYAPLDWLLVADRRLLPLRRVWVVLIYPVIWLTVVLIRGATDGWFPYPFLDPAGGYGSIAVVALGIAVAAIFVGILVFLASRLRWGSAALRSEQSGSV